MYDAAKLRAKKFGWEFSIDRSDIVIPSACPLLGIPLRPGYGCQHAGSPSLDRIDPSKGYVKGNVWVISFRANAIKQDATIQEIETLLGNLRRYSSASTLPSSGSTGNAVQRHK